MTAIVEWLAPGFIYSLSKDVLASIRGRRRALTPGQILELRQKWKPLFEEEIRKTHTNSLRKDVILRDVRRLDSYPEVNNKEKGISPWFKVDLIATYHKGISVGLRWGRLVKHSDVHNEWRFTNYAAGEDGDLKVLLVGRIPFENIESVDWRGDEYYYLPHIYCHFDTRKGEPYESLIFCIEKCNPGECPFYIEVTSYEQVQRVSKRLAVKQLF
jgi:hypothetical protein